MSRPVQKWNHSSEGSVALSYFVSLSEYPRQASGATTRSGHGLIARTMHFPAFSGVGCPLIEDRPEHQRFALSNFHRCARRPVARELALVLPRG
jgi:hypothetical protein